MTTNTTSTIAIEIVEGNVALMIMDDPSQSTNTMNSAFLVDLRAAVDDLEGMRENIRGVIITSAKPTFFAGGDLDYMMRATKDDVEDVYLLLTDVKGQLRRLERFGLPVVAAINGAALGGGYEIALAAHHRIVVDDPKAKVGLPEVTFGLLPGAGGVARTIRMLGLQRALNEVLLSGRQFRPQAALELGLVDAIAADAEVMIAQAKAWIAEHPDPIKPWDAPGFVLPGGGVDSKAVAGILPVLPAFVRRRTRGGPAPAMEAILAAAVEGAQVDIDTALDIETRYCTSLITGQVSTNLIKSQFFDMRAVKRRTGVQGEFPRAQAKKVAVVGAGMMGAAIAYVCANAGLEVALKDVSQEGADRGKGYSAKILDTQVKKGSISPEHRDAVLARITPTSVAKDLAGADVVIEAVFENPDLKRKVFAEIEEHVGKDALLGSNTSTLPINDLATGVSRPEDFIGLHFFSPVDRMPLLEIVVGARTSDETLARALDLSARIGKTAIVVNDSPGFFTTRVIVQYVLEAIAAVGEGIAPQSIEQAATQAGYPVGPLALVDELTLTLLRDIDDQRAEAMGVSAADRHPGVEALTKMIDAGRGGRAKRGGFYSYTDGVKSGLWNGLTELFGEATVPENLTEVQERMLFTEAIDSIRCLDEGVLTSVPDANVGSLLGIGYPAWTGGVLQYVNQFPGGPAGFVARADELAERHGPRFTPPQSLRDLAMNGKIYE